MTFSVVAQVPPIQPPAPEKCDTPGFGRICDVKRVIDVVTDPAAAAVDALAASMTESALGMIEELSSFWLEGDSTASFSLEAVESLQSQLTWLTYPILVIGTMVAIGKAYFSQSQSDLGAAGAGFGRVVLVGAAGPILLELMKGLDAYSVWLVSGAQDDVFNSGALIGGSALAAAPPFIQLFLSLVALVSSMVQYAMLLVRPVFVMLLMAYWPITAALTASGVTEPWERTTRWLVGWLSLKLAAGVSLALGSTLLRVDDSVAAGFTGVMVLILGAVALPVLMKAVSPGVRSVGAGMNGVKATGLVAGATLAAGAVAVAPVALAGGAGAAGATGAAGSTGAAGATGAAGTAGSAGAAGAVGTAGTSGSAGVSGGSGIGGLEKAQRVGQSAQMASGATNAVKNDDGWSEDV